MVGGGEHDRGYAGLVRGLKHGMRAVDVDLQNPIPGVLTAQPAEVDDSVDATTGSRHQLGVGDRPDHGLLVLTQRPTRRLQVQQPQHPAGASKSLTQHRPDSATGTGQQYALRTHRPAAHQIRPASPPTVTVIATGRVHDTGSERWRDASTPPALRSARTDTTLSHEPVDATDAAEPAEPMEAKDATEPTDSAEPAEPIDSTDSHEPIDNSELRDPIDSNDPVEAMERAAAIPSSYHLLGG